MLRAAHLCAIGSHTPARQDRKMVVRSSVESEFKAVAPNQIKQVHCQ